MKKHFYIAGRTILVPVILMMLFSCVSTQSFLIEIPRKGTRELPEKIQSLTIVNRTLDGSCVNLPSDTLQRLFYEKDFELDTVICDIQAIDTTLKALGELLFESGRYDVVIPEDRFLDFRKTSFLSLEMPWNEVEMLCNRYQTDALVAVDHYKTRVNTSYDSESFYNPSSGEYFSGYLAKIEINYEVLIRVYDPKEKKVIMREFLRDTLVWEDAAVSARELFSRFTPVKKALSETGVSVALDFADKISTNWIQGRRKYFTRGNKKLVEAIPLVNQSQWNNAIRLWQELESNTKSKALKSKAMLNIAVGYEMLGDIDEAIRWGLRSYETMYRPLTWEYLEMLNRRKNELKTMKNEP